MPEICTVKEADFRKAWQQNGTAKVPAFLSPHELGQLRTAVNASYELVEQHADDDPPTLAEYLVHHYKRWEGLWVKELRPYLDEARPISARSSTASLPRRSGVFARCSIRTGGLNPILRSSAATDRPGNTCPGISMRTQLASSTPPITASILGCRSIRSAMCCLRWS